MSDIRGEFDGSGMRIGVVVAEFNAAVTDGLLVGALSTLGQAGVAATTVVRVPGAFELPLAARKLAREGYDGIVALGAVIAGETDHYEHVAHRCSEGLMRVMLDEETPVGFGVLTARDAAAASDRSLPGPGNKGAEAAESVVRMVHALRSLRRWEKR
jgi:6,7-dimethyl-8-ribityllumazine synthase